MILWFGWIGFNAGSTSSMVSTVDADKAARSAMNTVLSGASGEMDRKIKNVKLKFFSSENCKKSPASNRLVGKIT